MHRAIRRGSTNFNHQKFLPNRGRLWPWKNALNTTVLLVYVMFLLVKWATNKPSYFPLWWLFFLHNPHIYPKQPRFLFIARICSNRDPTKLLVSQNPPALPCPSSRPIAWTWGNNFKSKDTTMSLWWSPTGLRPTPQGTDRTCHWLSSVFIKKSHRFKRPRGFQTPPQAPMNW